jgi:hypothetical protein
MPIKLIPILYLLKYDKTKLQTKDAICTLLLLVLYLIWLRIHGLNYFNYLKSQLNEKKVNTPVVNYLRKTI